MQAVALYTVIGLLDTSIGKRQVLETLDL